MTTLALVRDFPKFMPMEKPYGSDRYYVRDCYLEYYDLVLDLLKKKNAVALTGTPGTCIALLASRASHFRLLTDAWAVYVARHWSVFMAYFFQVYSEQYPEAIVTMASYTAESKLTTVVITQGGQVMKKVYTGTTASTALVEFMRSEDPERKNLWLLDGPPDWVCHYYRWVSFSSPTDSWMSKLDKNAESCFKVFMPTWTLDELRDAAVKLGKESLRQEISDEQQLFLDVSLSDGTSPRPLLIDCCFDIFGGVPRSFFSASDPDHLKMNFGSVRAAANNLTLDQIRKVLTNQDTEEQDL